MRGIYYSLSLEKNIFQLGEGGIVSSTYSEGRVTTIFTRFSWELVKSLWSIFGCTITSRQAKCWSRVTNMIYIFKMSSWFRISYSLNYEGHRSIQLSNEIFHIGGAGKGANFSLPIEKWILDPAEDFLPLWPRNHTCLDETCLELNYYLYPECFIVADDYCQ